MMKLMNSLTHSCTVSFASLAILAFAGSAFFMILLMLAMGRNLSCSLTLAPRSSSPAPAPPAPPSELMELRAARKSCCL